MVGFEVDALLPLIEEQQNLITGLVWATVIHVLRPWLEEYEILLVEEDLSFIVGCQCGAAETHGTGRASFPHHLQRGCQESSTILMSRPDLLLRNKLSGRLAYVEYKTTSGFGDRFITEWPTKIQFALGGLAAQANLGLAVEEYWVVGLNKGYRKGEYNPATKKYDGLEQQQSVACYGYRKLADPPLVPQEEWAPRFTYTDEWGVSRRLGKGWNKASTGDYPAAPGETPAESWIKSLPSSTRGELVLPIGPLLPKPILLEKLALQIAQQEFQWRERLWALYQGAEGIEVAPQEDPSLYWESLWQTSEFQALLDELFPQSFDCRRFGEKYKCVFERVCHLEAEWDRPLTGSSAYTWRTPHHGLEQEQMRERGLELALGEDDGEGGGGS